MLIEQDLHELCSHLDWARVSFSKWELTFHTLCPSFTLLDMNKTRIHGWIKPTECLGRIFALPLKCCISEEGETNLAQLGTYSVTEEIPWMASERKKRHPAAIYLHSLSPPVIPSCTSCCFPVNWLFKTACHAVVIFILNHNASSALNIILWSAPICFSFILS